MSGYGWDIQPYYHQFGDMPPMWEINPEGEEGVAPDEWWIPGPEDWDGTPHEEIGPANCDEGDEGDEADEWWLDDWDIWPGTV